MEFQAYNVLVIACDIRQLEHIEYTPAPDIIHEGAGHAPIIANPEYAEYLRRFMKLDKAISSARDYELYESDSFAFDFKKKKIRQQKKLKGRRTSRFLQNNMGELSEMSRIRNLHWWTEYGLIETVDDPKNLWCRITFFDWRKHACMTDNVKKIPYDISWLRI